MGRVLALGSTMERGEGLGLLGNDVLMRYHTVVSFADAELRFSRPPPRPSRRLRGPRGAPCQKERGARVPCVEVRLVDAQGRPPGEDVLEGVCLRTDVHPAYAGSTVELAITATGEAGEPLFGGGALRAYLTVGEEGASRCFWLWKQLERLGFSRNSRLSLRWVRTEGVIWPCDPEKTDCISFTGPLAKLELR